MRVGDVMTVHTARIRHTSNMHHAAEIVALSGVSDLMVVDEANNFIGVLSEGDILRAALPDLEEVLAEGGSLEDAFRLFIERGEQMKALRIEPLVIREPIVVGTEDHVAKVAVVLVERQIRRLPVVEGGKLVGTVSRADICRAVVGTL